MQLFLSLPFSTQRITFHLPTLVFISKLFQALFQIVSSSILTLPVLLFFLSSEQHEFRQSASFNVRQQKIFEIDFHFFREKLRVLNLSQKF